MKNLLTDEDSMEDTRTLERPSRVTTAVHMLYLSLGFPVAGAFLQCVLPEGNRSEGLVVLGSLPLPLLLYCMIRRGKDWARITFVIMSVLNVAALVDRSLINPPLFDSREISLLSLGIAEVCIDLAALALLFQPDSSDWFRAMSGPPKNRFKNMLGSLRNTDQPVLSYVWRAWLIALVPSMVLGSIVGLTMPNKGPSFDGPVWFTVLGILLIGPWVETLFMWPILWILTRTTGTTLGVAAVSAGFWGLMHSLCAPAWGLAVAWPFFVFSLCFLEWKKVSMGKAIAVTALVHTCQNLVPSFIMVLAALFPA